MAYIRLLPNTFSTVSTDGDLSSDDINMNTTVQSQIVAVNIETEKYETIFHAGAKLVEA